MLQLGCKGLICACLLIVPLIIFVGVLLEVDPLHGLFPPTDSLPILAKCISFLARLALLLVFASELCKGVCGTLLFGLMLVSSWIEGMARLSEFLKKANTGDDTTQKLKIMSVCRELQLWNQYVNLVFCYSAAPPLFLFGMGIVVLANYGAIKLRHQIPLLLYPFLPFTVVMGLMFVVTLLPLGASVHGKSKSLGMHMRSSPKSMRENWPFP